MGEEWRKCTVDSNYSISSHGRVRRDAGTPGATAARVLKQYDGNDYPMVTLSKKSSNKSCRIHRLVALAFLPAEAGRDHVNHIDGDKSNNNLSNLEWCSVAENGQHASAAGLLPVGEDNFHAKLTCEEVLHIRSTYAMGGASQRQLARKYGMGQSTIGAILRGQSWKHLPLKPALPPKPSGRDEEAT